MEMCSIEVPSVKVVVVGAWREKTGKRGERNKSRCLKFRTLKEKGRRWRWKRRGAERHGDGEKVQKESGILKERTRNISMHVNLVASSALVSAAVLDMEKPV